MSKFTHNKSSERMNEMNRMNNQMQSYTLTSYHNPTRKNYVDATKEIGVYQQTNLGEKSIHIDNESKFLNGKSGNTSTRDKDRVSKILMPSPYATTPNLKLGNVPEVEHDPNNRYGRMTREFKKNMDLSGITINRFIPMVPEVKRSVNYYEQHINPTQWVRGGMDTRTVMRNSDYLKTCGKR